MTFFVLVLSAAIFVVTFLLLGFNLIIALIVTFTVAVIIVDLLGLMYIWNISLNAVSLVNLVMVWYNSDSDLSNFLHYFKRLLQKLQCITKVRKIKQQIT